MKLFDGLVNLVSGMGTGRDKASGAQYTASFMGPQELLTAYNGSALVQRVIDMPAEDSFREWREWQGDAEQISRIEAEEKRLDLVAKLVKCRKMARLFGGAALLIGNGSNDASEPLNVESIGSQGIQYLTLLTRHQLSAGEVNRDVLDPGFGKPSSYSVASGKSDTVDIHPSRLVIMHGREPLPSGFGAVEGWGRPELEGLLTRVRAVDESAANVLSLIYEAKVDVFGIPGLMENMRTRGDEYSEEIKKRMTLAATGKGLSGAIIRDAEEEYDQKSASFGSLPEVMDRFMVLASGASGIPMTLLFGRSPGGLNSTGESDTRGYYDRIKVQQTMVNEPAMHLLDEAIIRSSLGSRPEELHYNWRPLWQPTAKERAETGKIIADTFKIVAETTSLAPEAIEDALVNGLTEAGAAPGLEKAASEMGRSTPDPIEAGDE